MIVMCLLNVSIGMHWLNPRLLRLEPTSKLKHFLSTHNFIKTIFLLKQLRKAVFGIYY